MNFSGSSRGKVIMLASEKSTILMTISSKLTFIEIIFITPRINNEIKKPIIFFIDEKTDWIPVKSLKVKNNTNEVSKNPDLLPVKTELETMINSKTNDLLYDFLWILKYSKMYNNGSIIFFPILTKL